MKEEPVQDDRDRDAWLGPMLRQSPLAADGACVDTETLAAWAEGALDAQQAAAVELHASNCSRCMALLASMERTTPVPEEPKPTWAIGPWLRWLVPLTAVATAVAIWVMVPDRTVMQVPVTQVQPVPAPRENAAPTETRSLDKEADLQAPKPAPEPGTASPEQPTAPLAARSDTFKKQERAPAGQPDDAQLRDENRRERQAAEAFSPVVPTAPPPATAPDRAAASPAPVPPSAAPSAPSEPSARMFASGVANETVTQRAMQDTMAGAVPSSESTSPSNPLIRWRVLSWVSVERSIDGGKTWIKASSPPGVTVDTTPMLWVVSIRAVDNLRGAVLTSDRSEFYTTNGGLSWVRVQENSVAPF